MHLILRGFILLLFLLGLWQCIILIFQLPDYILPSPFHVFYTAWIHRHLLLRQAIPTVIETLLGLSLGILFGSIAALMMAWFRPLSLWFFPLFIMSQAIPTFAIAPLLVIWFGYGMTSKIVTTVIMLFFPITSAFLDGLKRTETGWLDLAKTMNATRMRIFWYIRIPAALPSLVSGIRVAIVIAPLGAVVGEWVGASQGLGYLMLMANARVQTDLMFAALFTIMMLALLLYFVSNILLRKLIPWQVER